MAATKILKVGVDGIPTENALTDDITFNSYTVQGGGPALSGAGLAMANQSITALADITFTAPSTDTINQTAGNLIIDNIMAKDRANVMAVGATVDFPTITDSTANNNAFRLPQLAGIPSAVPSAGGTGQLIYDTADDAIYLYNGTKWRNLNDVSDAQSVDDFYTAAASLASCQAVYLSAADSVSPAVGSSPSTSQVLGFAVLGGASASTNNRVRKFGKLAGFTSLTSGSRYYLDPTTAGAITATVPTVSGSTICQVGYAKNTTTLDIAIQGLGRRA